MSGERTVLRQIREETVVLMYATNLRGQNCAVGVTSVGDASELTRPDELVAG
jgi:hypothetical protein